MREQVACSAQAPIRFCITPRQGSKTAGPGPRVMHHWEVIPGPRIPGALAGLLPRVAAAGATWWSSTHTEQKPPMAQSSWIDRPLKRESDKPRTELQAGWHGGAEVVYSRSTSQQRVLPRGPGWAAPLTLPDLRQLQPQPRQPLAPLQRLGCLDPLHHHRRRRISTRLPDLHSPLFRKQQPAQPGAVGEV